ncbi:MAG: hypothetical protein HDR88_08765 [Bacteroides sp.]|nr:hypothetical protein [Bacteroides sp.]
MERLFVNSDGDQVPYAEIDGLLFEPRLSLPSRLPSGMPRCMSSRYWYPCGSGWVGHLKCQAEQFFEYAAETVLHLRCYIFEDRRYGLFKFDG